MNVLSENETDEDREVIEGLQATGRIGSSSATWSGKSVMWHYCFSSVLLLSSSFFGLCHLSMLSVSSELFVFFKQLFDSEEEEEEES